MHLIYHGLHLRTYILTYRYVILVLWGLGLCVALADSRVKSFSPNSLLTRDCDIANFASCSTHTLFFTRPPHLFSEHNTHCLLRLVATILAQCDGPMRRIFPILPAHSRYPAAARSESPKHSFAHEVALVSYPNYLTSLTPVIL